MTYPCTKCKVEKPLEAFSVSKGKRHPHCRLCRAAYYKKNQDDFNKSIGVKR
jgi:hypothetical protein